jgi:hypothetical protein
MLGFQLSLPTQILVDGAWHWSSKASMGELRTIWGLCYGEEKEVPEASPDIMGGILEYVLEEDHDEEEIIKSEDIVKPLTVIPLLQRELLPLLISIFNINFTADGKQWVCPQCRRGNSDSMALPCKMCQFDVQAAAKQNPRFQYLMCVDHICQMFERVKNKLKIFPAPSTRDVMKKAATAFVTSLKEDPSLLEMIMALVDCPHKDDLIDICHRDFVWMLQHLDIETFRRLEAWVGSESGGCGIVVLVMRQGLVQWLEEHPHYQQGIAASLKVQPHEIVSIIFANV